jgi:hypothetical protein
LRRWRKIKFGDVITAVAATIVLVVIVSFLVGLPFSLSVSVASDWADTVVTVVAFLVSALIVGYAFARRIWSENGIEAITKMTLLSAVFLILYVENFVGLSSWNTMVTQAIQNANPTITFTATQLFNLESRVLGNLVFVNVILALAIAFVGFYAGSKLRKT